MDLPLFISAETFWLRCRDKAWIYVSVRNWMNHKR